MSATQLRLGLFGLSEVVFLFILCAAPLRFANSLCCDRRIFNFFICFFAALFVGSFYRIIQIYGASFPFYDLFSLLYGLTAAIILTQIYRIEMADILFGSFLAIIFMATILLFEILQIHFPYPFDVWYGSAGLGLDGGVGRFRGWSLNPNQLGLFLLGALFYLIHFCKWAWIIKLICMAPFFLVVFYNDSGGTLMAILVMVAVYFLTTVRWLLSMLFVFIGFLGVSYLVVDGFYDYDSFVVRFFDSNGRVNLWINGIKAGMMSPIWGWGPGAHSGIGEPFEGWEAHSTFIDLFSQVGVVGLSAFLYLVLAAIYSVSKGSTLPLLALLAAFLLFASVHYVLRFPVFWVVLFSVVTQRKLHSLGSGPALLHKSREGFIP